MKLRAKRRRFKPVVPSVMGNVGSLGNKMVELCALIRTRREYLDSSLMYFTETWLHMDFPEHSASVSSFTHIQADRDVMLIGKRKGRRIAVLINERWCNSRDTIVK